jgi:asparagine synthase (glutamine-hydrolysing)
LWVTADARIDGRAELIKKLGGAGLGGPKDAPDAELILRAYAAWGEDCVKHLIGDFSFAVWDAPRRRLFCARDHFGVRPFYYARVRDCLVFSNTLNCLRLHPSVSAELNERAVGDFLLFDFNYDLSTTVFADVQRLPPAHSFAWTTGEPRPARYWAMPTDGRVRYRQAGDYVDRFKELLSSAVEDRLRTRSVGVFMSGGLDSPALAAAAREVTSRTGAPLDLQAYTVVYRELIPDDESHYAGVAAEALGIPINYFAADDYRLFERSSRPECSRPEPVPDPLVAVTVDLYWQVAAHGRVVLCGHGPDAVLSTQFPLHVGSLFRGGRPARALMDVARYALWQRRLPPVGLRTFLRRRVGSLPPPPPPQMPSWLNPDFVARANLAERFRQVNEEPAPKHPTHPRAYDLLASPFWPYMFERDNADVSLLPVENRYPFFDVRLVSYMLALPVARWCVDKKLLREATRGILPRTVRLRPKTPLAGDVLQARLDRGERPWAGRLDSLPGLSRYVIPANGREFESDGASNWDYVRLLAFSDWMTHALGVNNESIGRGNHAPAR